MGITRLGPAHQGLQQAVQRGGGAEILGAGDEAYSLERVVMGHREMVARRHVTPGEHHVAEGRGIARDAPHPHFLEAERAGDERKRPRHVEPKHVRRSRREAGLPLTGGETAAGPGIARRTVRREMRGGGRSRRLSRDLGPAAETGIDEAARRKRLQHRPVFSEMGGLHPHRLLPGKAEPAEILDQGRSEVRAAAGGIDVLDPEQKPPARLAREAFGEKRSIGMAEMEMAGGRGGETGGLGAHQERRRA